MQEFLKSLLTAENIEWAAGALIALLGIGLSLKKLLSNGAEITKELGEAFLATSDVLKKANEAIKADGSLKENSVQELINAGKTAKLEWEDVVLTIKPKRKRKNKKGPVPGRNTQAI